MLIMSYLHRKGTGKLISRHSLNRTRKKFAFLPAGRVHAKMRKCEIGTPSTCAFPHFPNIPISSLPYSHILTLHSARTHQGCQSQNGTTSIRRLPNVRRSR